MLVKKGTNFKADVKKRKKEDFCVLMTEALRFHKTLTRCDWVFADRITGDHRKQ